MNIRELQTFVEVKHLKYSIGNTKILQDLSFSLEKGQILGLLGTNGAGKSTTMRCLVGILKPQSGEILIMDRSVIKNPELTKIDVGYLAEHNPLYADMYTKEYLTFVGRLRGVSARNITEALKRVVENCSLQSVENKKIKHLSKGFRQRVGIAAAIIHSPSVIILDEPTSGLDPQQITEIRNLIKIISVDKAVLLSTHIIQEMLSLCSRIIFLKSGIINVAIDVQKVSYNELEQLFFTQVS